MELELIGRPWWESCWFNVLFIECLAQWLQVTRPLAGPHPIGRWQNTPSHCYSRCSSVLYLYMDCTSHLTRCSWAFCSTFQTIWGHCCKATRTCYQWNCSWEEDGPYPEDLLARTSFMVTLMSWELCNSWSSTCSTCEHCLVNCDVWYWTPWHPPSCVAGWPRFIAEFCGSHYRVQPWTTNAGQGRHHRGCKMFRTVWRYHCLAQQLVFRFVFGIMAWTSPLEIEQKLDIFSCDWQMSTMLNGVCSAGGVPTIVHCIRSTRTMVEQTYDLCSGWQAYTAVRWLVGRTRRWTGQTRWWTGRTMWWAGRTRWWTGRTMRVPVDLHGISLKEFLKQKECTKGAPVLRARMLQPPTSHLSKASFSWGSCFTYGHWSFS